MATIICIEDETASDTNIAEVLKDAGYNVKVARDGAEGMEMILKHKPDLVLCDIITHQKDGYRLLREVRKTSPLLDDTSIIFLSPSTEREQILTGLKEGADGYLAKPIDSEFLQAMVQASLRQIERFKQKQRNIKEQRQQYSDMDYFP